MRDFHIADTNMLVSKKPGGPNAKPGRPNAKPGGPNAIQFVLGMQGFDLCWPCTFHVVFVPFSMLGMQKLLNANVVSGGLQA